MSFYNRNKKQASTTKVNKNLATSKIIELASDQPEYRAVFYQKLLNNKVYVLVDSGYDTRNLTAGIDPNIPILTFENQVIPIFTEKERIFDSGAINHEVDYIVVEARPFFEMSLGSPIIVNPFSRFYKELVPREISQMLNGSIFKPNQSDFVHVKMNAIIGKPSHEPSALLDDLRLLFAKNPLVSQAHIAWTDSQEMLVEPHYIIAVEANEYPGEFKHIAQDISQTCKKHLEADQIIDIIKLEPGGNFSDYFYNQSTAFYQKS
ncbi:enhanced serine sensitivity protein SseB C-terminal domain-containing protein [Myroides sp. LJL119]